MNEETHRVPKLTFATQESDQKMHGLKKKNDLKENI